MYSLKLLTKFSITIGSILYEESVKATLLLFLTPRARLRNKVSSGATTTDAVSEALEAAGEVRPVQSEEGESRGE